MNDYGTMRGSKRKKKETYVFISLFTWTFTVLQTSVEARPVREVVLCVFFLEDAFPQRLLPKQKLSVKHGVNCCIFNEGEGCVVKGHLPTPTPPSLPAGFGVTLRPGPLALWPVFRWDCGNWGWAARPWRINQKALLVRVFSSMLCLCVYPNALEDYLSWWGLLMCRTGWVMLEWFGLC